MRKLSEKVYFSTKSAIIQTLRKAEHMCSTTVVNGPNKLINNCAKSDTLAMFQRQVVPIL